MQSGEPLGCDGLVGVIGRANIRSADDVFDVMMPTGAKKSSLVRLPLNWVT